MANGTLYTGHSDGTWVRRTFSGSTFGPGTAVDTWSNDIGADMNSMTGIFFDTVHASRLLHAVRQQQSLLAPLQPRERHLQLPAYTASGAVAALNPSRVRGMFISDGTLYFGDSTAGALYKMPFTAVRRAARRPWRTTPPTGARGRCSCRTAPSRTCHPSPPSRPRCTVNVCAFDGAGSTDSDGAVASYAWDFGDGETGTGSAPEHTYRSGGTFTVTLTVTDDRVGSGLHLA